MRDMSDGPHPDIDPTRFADEFASALWLNRYRWGEAGLRDHKEGLLIFNPGDRNSREMLAFHDTVPNATYGPLCRWGDAEVRADVRFEPDGKPPAAFGAQLRDQEFDCEVFGRPNTSLEFDQGFTCQAISE